MHRLDSPLSQFYIHYYYCLNTNFWYYMVSHCALHLVHIVITYNSIHLVYSIWATPILNNHPCITP